jgi:hypothetical protein
MESLTSDDQLLRTPHYSLTETHHLTRVTAYNMTFEFSDDVLKLKRRNLKLNLKDEIVLQSYSVAYDTDCSLPTIQDTLLTFLAWSKEKVKKNHFILHL